HHTSHLTQFFFFFHAPPTTHIYTLSLHDALPISPPARSRPPPAARRGSSRTGAPSARRRARAPSGRCAARTPRASAAIPAAPRRSEEHTSELQSRFDLVCRLLLEKKKKNTTNQYK